MKSAPRVDRPVQLVGILSLVSIAAFICVVFRWGPREDYDTLSYLSHAFWRTPAYPLLLDLFKLVGGRDYAIWGCAFQTAAILCVSVYFTLALKRDFPDWLLIVVFCLAASPLATVHAGDTLATEGAAYAVFLTCITLGSTIT